MRRAAVLALAVLLAAGAARAEWHESYDEGKKAVRDKRWDDAVRALRAALQAQPGEGKSKRTYGMNFVDYIPHYFLGVALYNQGQRDEALRELERAESSGVVQKTDQAGRFLILLDELRKGEAEPARATPPPPAPSPSPAFTRPVPTSTPPLPTPTSPPRPADNPRIDQARALAREGRGLLDEGHLAQAENKLKQADLAVPDLPEARAGLDAVAKRRGEYRKLMEQAGEAEQSGDLGRARERYLQAEKKDRDAARGDDIEGRLLAMARRQEAAELSAGAKQAFDRGRWEDAVSQARRALEKDPARREAEPLLHRAQARLLLREGEALEKKGELKRAQEKLLAAMSEDRELGEVSGALARVNGKIKEQTGSAAPPPPPPPTPTPWLPDPTPTATAIATPIATPVQPRTPRPAPSAQALDPLVGEALRELFAGRPELAIKKLEAVADAGDARAAGYLGVAYATLALKGVEGTESQARLARAREHYKRARALDPDFRLPERLFSPRLREALEN